MTPDRNISWDQWKEYQDLLLKPILDNIQRQELDYIRIKNELNAVSREIGILTQRMANFEAAQSKSFKLWLVAFAAAIGLIQGIIILVFREAFLK